MGCFLMDLILEGVIQALRLLIMGDPEVIRVTLLSLQVSLGATALSLAVGMPLGTALALNHFPGRNLAVSFVNTGMGVPPTVVGLIGVILLWRSGPFGFTHIIYTPWAIMIAQFAIATPIITGITLAAIQQINPKLRLQILSLGANRWQYFWLLIREARLPLMAATMAGFGAVISEVGAAIMVGGNIMGHTRVLTTAIVMESSKGEFALAIALGVILMLMVYLVNLVLTTIQQRARPL